ncbi:hypothetical protein BR93DRAFT_699214 [Coniochaeta sp. PMI_546]|nr:hypothetical protein BR93DRAFT_699214 [Coniochaeta sp. PMI_546]
MHIPSFYQRLALFYIYLINFAFAEPILQHASRRSIFGPDTAEFDRNGDIVAKDIVKSTGARLEVTNTLQNAKGEWHQVRSLGGPMAVKWLQLHGDGHPNTTVRWSNGTVVAAHEVHALIHLAKRWGWGDTAIELTLWGASAFTISNGGLVAGFGVAVVAALYGFARSLLSNGKSSGSVVEGGNNQKAKRNNFEPNVFYRQNVANQQDTGHWPSGNDIQNAVHSSLQDMADHDYQGACYDAVTNDQVFGPGEGCPITEFAQLGFCSWPNGGSCTTPSCHLSLGQHTQCSGSRAADAQYGK